MHIYNNNVYEFGEKLWDKSPKRPTKIAGLSVEIWLERGERKEFTFTLMKKWVIVCLLWWIVCYRNILRE